MKEQDKVIIAKLILKITFIMIFISVGIKLLGFNLFDADYENMILSGIAEFIENFDNNILRTIINFLLLYLQIFVLLRITCTNENVLIYRIYAFSSTLFMLFIQFLIHNIDYITNYNLDYFIYNILSFIIIVIPPFFIDRKIINRTFWQKLKSAFIITLFILLYQSLVLFLRNITLTEKYDLIYNFLLNFDYIILILITYFIFLNGKLKQNKFIFFINFDLLELLNTNFNKKEIISAVDKIKDNYLLLKKQSKSNKIIFYIYITLFIIQEFLTLGLVFFVANLNNYMIECVFILTAFMISKKVFGAFHFKSFIVCFFVSNITFFILSKVTIDINITFVIPILLGILLSYISSRFIKKQNKQPYRGIPKEDLSRMCCMYKLNKMESDILIDYYSNRYNLEKLAIKYNYSDRSIQRIKGKALKKLNI